MKHRYRKLPHIYKKQIDFAHFLEAYVERLMISINYEHYSPEWMFDIIFQISPGTPGEICRWYFHPLLGKQRRHGLARAEWPSPQPSAHHWRHRDTVWGEHVEKVGTKNLYNFTYISISILNTSFIKHNQSIVRMYRSWWLFWNCNFSLSLTWLQFWTLFCIGIRIRFIICNQ